MKISEMTNEQATESLIRIADPIGNICEDEQAINLIDEYKKMSDVPFVKAIGKLIPKFITYLVKGHKDDLYEIVGALTFQTKEQVSKMNFVETINIVRNSWDEVLASFFPSAVKPEKKAESES